MKNFLSRLIILLTAFPLLFFVIFIFDFHQHLLFNLLVVGVTFLGSLEISQMFAKKRIPTLRITGPILAATLPLYAFLREFIPVMTDFFGLWLAVIFTIIVTAALFTKNDEALLARLPFAASSVFIVFYPAFFLMFIVGMTTTIHPRIILLVFLLPVFLNDIAAYSLGKLARGKTCLHLPASPNKTLIGFIAGFLTSIGTFVAFSFLLTDYFILPLAGAIILGIVIGVTTIIGDLFESALKRSCQIKDSGVIMGGGGGLMDTIDSLLISAPVFYYLFFLIAIPVS